MKRNDLLPIFACQLTNPDGTFAQLAGAAVFFNMSSNTAAKITRGACAIIDADTGEVEYTWQAGDTDTAGFFKCEFEVVYPVAKPMTYPNKGYIALQIEEDLG